MIKRSGGFLTLTRDAVNYTVMTDLIFATDIQFDLEIVGVNTKIATKDFSRSPVDQK